MDIDLIGKLMAEIARPLIIIILVVFLTPWLVKKRKEKGLKSGQNVTQFISAVDKVMKRINNVLDDPLLIDKDATASADDIVSSWQKVDAQLKQIAFDYCQVKPDLKPYPIDYVLFELEMKKKVGNTTIGFYQDLTKLKDMAIKLPGQDIPSLTAVRYCRLAEHVSKMLGQGPLPGLGGLF